MLVNLYYIIELLLFDENGVKISCTAVCSLWKHCSKGYNIFVQCFPNNNFMIGL